MIGRGPACRGGKQRTRGGPGLGLTELLAALSLGTDLGMGDPMEHVLRQTVIAQRLAGWAGCHVDAYEQAKWLGDDRAVKHEIRSVDLGKPLESGWIIARHIGAGRPLGHRVGLGLAFMGEGRRAVEDTFDNHWRAASGLAARLGFDQAVIDSVGQTFERWDGKGVPDGAKGEDVLIASRVVNLADVVEVFHQAGGLRRSGSHRPPMCTPSAPCSA